MNYKNKFVAVFGSSGVALSSLLMSVLLIQTSTPEEYGLFAFILVAQALSSGICNALLGTPLLIILSESEEKQEKIKSFMFFSILLSSISFFIQFLIVFFHTGSINTALAFGFAGFFWLTRWFGRLYCDYTFNNKNVVICDVVYTILTLILIAYLHLQDSTSLLNYAVVICLSSVVSTFFLHRDFLIQQIFCLNCKDYSPFFNGFKTRGRHSLLGVITTEFTANAHVYFIVFLLGPIFFAPIAAAMLLFRPLMIITNTLSQLELPRLRNLYVNNSDLTVGIINFLKYNIFSFSIVQVFIILFLIFYGEIFWPEDNTFDDFIKSVVIFSTILLIRSVKIPLSILLQAQDRFKELSWITVYSCVITIPSCLIILLNFGAIQSLLGVLIGDIIALFLILKKTTKSFRCFL